MKLVIDLNVSIQKKIEDIKYTVQVIEMQNDNANTGRKTWTIKKMSPQLRREEIDRLYGIIFKNNAGAAVVMDEIRQLLYLSDQILKTRSAVFVDWAEHKLKNGLVFSVPEK